MSESPYLFMEVCLPSHTLASSEERSNEHFESRRESRGIH